VEGKMLWDGEKPIFNIVIGKGKGSSFFSANPPKQALLSK